jgi:hypothetical protein
MAVENVAASTSLKGRKASNLPGERIFGWDCSATLRSPSQKFEKCNPSCGREL